MMNAPRPLALQALSVLASGLALMAHPDVLEAQVPVTSLGLGAPVAATDGRTAALGGAAVGLLGGSLNLLNPADLTGFAGNVIGLSLNPESITLVTAGGEDQAKRSRIGLMQAVVPIGRWVVGVGLRNELDQDFLVVFPDTLVTSFGRFPFEEKREHDGGISSLDISLARRVGPLTVGVSGGPVFGALRQVVSRRFEADPTGVMPTLTPVEDFSRLTYAASRIRGGLAWEADGRFRIGGSVSRTSALEADQQDTGVTQQFDMPIEVAFGGSARLSPKLLLAASGGWSQWSRAKGDFNSVGVASVTWAGGGIEWSHLTLGSASVPLRLGYRFADLPFFPIGRRQARETAVTFGLGLSTAGGKAVLDLSGEVGSRGEAAVSGFEESFTRTALTISIRRP
ncbi:MAG: hypothetical protein ABFS14_00185 [Gemmatimonadota bacterium]